MTSDVIHTLLNSVLVLGFQFKALHPNADLKDLEPIYNSRTLLRKVIISLGSEASDSLTNYVVQAGFVAITLDAGTIGHRHSMFVLCSSPAGFSTVHQFLASPEIQSFDAKDYKKFAEDMVTKVELFAANASGNVIVTAFVGDRLPAQVRGIAHYRKGSASATLAIKWFFSPCYCHIINTCLIYIIKNDKKIAYLVFIAKNLCIFCRKHPIEEKLGAHMPSIPETRWIYVFDQILWIYTHANDINKLLNEDNKCTQELINAVPGLSNGIPNELFLLMNVLLPIKKFQLTVEKDTTLMAQVYPLYLEMINQIEKISNDMNNSNVLREMALSVHKLLVYKFELCARMPLLKLAYSFTVSGRNEIRKAHPSLCKHFNFPQYLNQFPTIKDINFRAEDGSDYFAQYEEACEEIEEIYLEAFERDFPELEARDSPRIISDLASLSIAVPFDSNPRQLYPVQPGFIGIQRLRPYPQPTAVQEDNGRSQEDNEVPELGNNSFARAVHAYEYEEGNESAEDITNETDDAIVFDAVDFDDVYNTALVALTKYVKRFNTTYEYEKHIVEVFNNWLFEDDKSFPSYPNLSQPDGAFWRALITTQPTKTNTNLTDLIGYALRLLNIPASSSDCERQISASRNLLGKNRQSMKEDLVDAISRIQVADPPVPIQKFQSRNYVEVQPGNSYDDFYLQESLNEMMKVANQQLLNDNVQDKSHGASKQTTLDVSINRQMRH